MFFTFATDRVDKDLVAGAVPRLLDRAAEADSVYFDAIEQIRRRLDYPFQGTVATSDGESIWAVRYSSEQQSRSLYYSTDVSALRRLHPQVEVLQRLSAEARLVVSEPRRCGQHRTGSATVPVAPTLAGPWRGPGQRLPR